MAAYQRINDGYEWQLALPPVAVAALLTAVCVDQSGGKNAWQAIGHLLLGPKSWSIRFEGQAFRLSPLGHFDSTFRIVLSPTFGKLIASKSGTCLRLESHATATQWLAVKAIGVVAAIFALVIATLATASLSSHLDWLVWPIRIVLPLWFLIAFTWLVPRSIERAPLDFLDDLVADYITS